MASNNDQAAYNELAYYTLAHAAPSFIHQHIVDAFMAQHCDEDTKPIAVTFALVGLYLYIEKGFTGKLVQRTHMQLAKRRKDWPNFAVPEQKGDVTVFDVLASQPGDERDNSIKTWCGSVWAAWRESRQQIMDLLKAELEIE